MKPRRVPGIYFRPDDGGTAGGGAPETPERPEWLLDRYQNAEEQARAYAESQAEMHRMRQQMEQERASFTQALEGLQQAEPPQHAQVPGQQQAFDPAMSAYAMAYESGDIQGMLAAQAQYTMQPTIEAVGRLIDEKLGQITPAVQQAQAAQREHDLRLAEGLVERTLGPDQYAELLPRIRELAADHPNYLPQQTSVEGYRDAILNIAKLAQHDILARENEQLRQEQAEKRAAQTLTGGFNRSPADMDAAKAEFERIKGTQTGSFSELMQRARQGNA